MINSRLKAQAEYYREFRESLVNLAIPGPKKVLEVGCASGQTLAHFKNQGAEFVAGIELVPEVAENARNQPEIDLVITGSVEEIDFSQLPGPFDLIIASHVLEHLVDPWKILKELGHELAPGGQFLGAIPNLRHFSVLLPLLLAGKWQYEESGILDWTHLRFFTRATIEQLIQSSGLQPDKLMADMRGPKSKLLSRLTLGVFENFLAYSYHFSLLKQER